MLLSDGLGRNISERPNVVSQLSKYFSRITRDLPDHTVRSAVNRR